MDDIFIGAELPACIRCLAAVDISGLFQLIDRRADGILAFPVDKPKGRGIAAMEEIESYRALILENIEYDFIKQDYGLYLSDLDEIVEVMVETLPYISWFTREL